MDKYFNFNDHIHEVTRIARYHLRNIASIRKYLN